MGIERIIKGIGISLVGGFAIWAGAVVYNLYSGEKEFNRFCQQTLFTLADTNEDNVLSEDERARMYHRIWQIDGIRVSTQCDWSRDYAPTQ